MDVRTFTDDSQPTPTDKYAQDIIKALEEINSTSKSLADAVDSLTARIRNNELPTKSGLSFLELRNLLLVMYEANLAAVAETKVDGKSLSGNNSIMRIVETRTVIEKMRPIYHKLKYRIDKLIRAANSKGTVNQNDPLQLKPNPSAFDVDDEDRETNEAGDKMDDDTRQSTRDKSRKYVPPKVSSVRFEDDTLEEKQKKLLERAKKRALNSSLIQELRNEFDEAPEEINETSVGMRRHNKQEKEREKYEEEYLTRLPLPKKSVAHKRRHEDGFMTIGSLGDDITRFDDVSALHEDKDPDSVFKKKKKRKVGQKTLKKLAMKKKRIKKRM